MHLLGAILLAATFSTAERDVLEKVNAHRRALGLGELAWHEPAAAEARRHCGDVLDAKAHAHEGFPGRAARLRRAAGAQRAGENLLLQAGTPFRASRAVVEWLESEGHRRAVEGPFQLSGVGVVQRGGRVCAAQIFLGR